MKYLKLTESECDSLFKNTGIVLEWQNGNPIAIRILTGKAHIKISPLAYGNGFELSRPKGIKRYKVQVTINGDLQAEKVFETDRARKDWIKAAQEKYNVINEELILKTSEEVILEDAALMPKQLNESGIINLAKDILLLENDSDHNEVPF